MNFLIRVLRQVLDVSWSETLHAPTNTAWVNSTVTVFCDSLRRLVDTRFHAYQGEVSADGRPRNAIDLDLFYIHVVSSGNSELLNTPSPGIPSNFDFCSVPLFPYGGWENCWVYNPVVSLGMMLSWISSVVFPLLSFFLYKCCSFYCIIVVYIC